MGAWRPDRVRADLLAHLAVIREALGDPAAPVPWFRAPNGSWGCTAPVAVELGLQPLGVTGTIDDWRTQDVTTLDANLRAAHPPGRHRAGPRRRWRPVGHGGGRRVPCCRSGWMTGGTSPARRTPTSTPPAAPRPPAASNGHGRIGVTLTSIAFAVPPTA